MAGHPYRLFSLLADPSQLPDSDSMGPDCLFDELTATFFRLFPDRSNPISPDAEAYLRALAMSIDVDIATLEAKHASTRRICQLRGTQTWAPSLETVSAEWVARQISINEQNAGSYGPKKEETQKKKRKPGKNEGAKGGGGGACRAYFHVHHQGRKMTAKSIKETLEAFRSLGPEQKAHYEDLGRAGTLAWRQGHKAFPDVGPRRLLPDGEKFGGDKEHFVRQDGVIVGAPAEPLPETLIPYRSRDFSSDIKKIRSKIYKAAVATRKLFQDPRHFFNNWFPRSFNLWFVDTGHRSFCLNTLRHEA